MQRILILVALILWGSGIFFTTAQASPEDASDPLHDALRERIEMLREAPAGVLTGDMASLHTIPQMAQFYEERGFQPVWVAPMRQKMTAYALRAALRQAEREGLQSAEYHLEAMQETLSALRTANPEERAAHLIDLELLCSDAFLLYAGHLLNGRVDPQRLMRSWNIEPRVMDLLDSFQAIDNGSAVHEALRSLRPQHDGYTALRTALARYRGIVQDGGWSAVDAGPTLERGMDDPRVAQLRARLETTERLDPVPDSLATVFDDALHEAVLAFQDRHGLATDGRVGPATLGALNVSAEARVDQIIVNLERVRWLPSDLGRRYVLVNIASFGLYVAEEGEIVLDMPVVVGRPYRQTPVFSDEISYLVMSPYWHVPHSIATRDKLPEFKRDPSAVARQGFQLFRGWSANAQPVDPMSIEWESLNARNFPYRMRQNPGPNNALGQVKFMFPNEHNVYLHDTPTQHLFGRPERGFSSGCIRVAQPVELAEYLLRENEGWDRAAIQRNMNRTAERAVTLTERVPVHLQYWTAWADSHGTVHFRNDIYNRDRDVQVALASRVTVPPVLHSLLESSNAPSARTTP